MVLFKTNDKSDLRSKMKRKRGTLASLYPRSGSQVAARFPAELVARGGLTIAGYAPKGSEINCLPLMDKLKARGAKMCLPVVETKHEPLIFRAWEPGQELVTSAFGIEEPAQDAAILVPDMLLVPLLAFNAKGFRLGYGGGYYDRTLEKLRAENEHLVAVGLGYEAQGISRMPVDRHDEKMDWIITETLAHSITRKTP
ncbi:5-formyltetrahydrofolate cyclo-ligase [hydrothermal vent metagenome]|uniref:5-formyltetrahydrofolate cyclo-ligase n=1 Tax=hydrothermal vent metagenome TaxID=652676 RepID=A0A3B0RD51_9ZZZZ